MRLWRRPLGLRNRVVLAFGIGALVVSAVLAGSTYLLALNYLLNQRVDAATRQSFIDARFVRARLMTAGADIPSALTAADPVADGEIVVRRGTNWYSSSLDVGKATVPTSLRRDVEAGRAASMRFQIDGAPRLVIGIPLPAVDAEFYEIVPLDELRETLRILGLVVVAGAVVAAAAGTGLGIWASRSVVRPLNDVARTATQIAGGRLDSRLALTRDPDLAAIVGSFNSMVDTLQERMRRDARLAADVSHELRSPLTTLVASVEVLDRHRSGLSLRSQQALNLVAAELDRFRHLLDNLLELAQVETGVELQTGDPVHLGDLVTYALTRSGRSANLVSGDLDQWVTADKLRMERVFVNLFENAESHGENLVAITLVAEHDQAMVLVDDSGPGVARDDRERIFERFSTGHTPRRSSAGTGLGLALVRETVSAHGGAVWCTDHAPRGSRFVVSLPRVER